MRERDLILIGTVHGDPDGMGSLLRLLRHENPIQVAVEVSPYGLFFRQRNGHRLLRLLSRRVRRVASPADSPLKGKNLVESIAAQIRFPFEYRASLRYCRDVGATLSCLDLSSFSRHLIEQGWEELIERRNIENLYRKNHESLRESTARAYGLAARLLREKGEALYLAAIHGWQKDDVWERREAHLANDLQRRWAMMERGTLAYVGGWEHLLSTEKSGTLFERLAHLRPRRLLLGEYARL